jgi:hypothetical protein
MYGLARKIRRTEMGKRIEQRRAVSRDSSEGARFTKEIATLVQLGQELDEETARKIIAAGRAVVEERLLLLRCLASTWRVSTHATLGFCPMTLRSA